MCDPNASCTTTFINTVTRNGPKSGPNLTFRESLFPSGLRRAEVGAGS